MKKIKLIILFICIFFTFRVNAEELKNDILTTDVSTTTNESVYQNSSSQRYSLPNYGVNKKWNINDSNINNVLNTPVVDSSKKIYDFSDILTDEEEDELYKLIYDYIRKTNMDMVIVSVDLPYTVDSKNDTYASDFYDYNDFGIDFEHYSGVLLLRNTYENDPFFNIYTFGEAQLYYDFDRCESMLDNIYPYLKNKNYLPGFKIFIAEFTNYYEDGIILNDYYLDDTGHLQKKYTLPYFWALLTGGLGSGLITSSLVKKNKMVKKDTRAKEYINTKSVVFNIKKDTLINSVTTHRYISYESSSGGGGGGFSSTGSSGGGFSSGGGRHG